MMGVELLTLIAEQAPSGSVLVPWWLRFGFIVYVVLLVASFMIYAQTKHQRPWSVIWVLIIALVPIAGAIAYFIAQTVRYRRTGAKPTKGRAERMPSEEYRDDDADPEPPRQSA